MHFANVQCQKSSGGTLQVQRTTQLKLAEQYRKPCKAAEQSTYYPLLSLNTAVPDFPLIFVLVQNSVALMRQFHDCPRVGTCGVLFCVYTRKKTKTEHLYSASNVTPSILNVVLGIVGSKINCHTVTYRSRSVKNMHGTGISILATQFANLVQGAFFFYLQHSTKTTAAANCRQRIMTRRPCPESSRFGPCL